MSDRHHQLTPFESVDINRARQLSQAVKRRADLETNPQVALARLERDMGTRAVNEIWRDVLAVFPDPDAVRGSGKAKDVSACVVCSASFAPRHHQQRTCSDACATALRRVSKKGRKGCANA